MKSVVANPVCFECAGKRITAGRRTDAAVECGFETGELTKVGTQRIDPSCWSETGGLVKRSQGHQRLKPRRSSTIIEMSKLLREYDSEYHFLFSHVLRFVEQPDAYDDHGYMIPNVLRRVLDVFLAFKCPGGGGLPSQLDKLCTDYPVLDRERLAALERLTQVESHSDNIDDLLPSQR